MTNRFFDVAPENWEDLENLVRQAFEEMGYSSRRGYPLQTVRGEVQVDVYATKNSTSVPTIVLCECKHWEKSVSQSVVHGFRTVCQDSGAHIGLIISKNGFQSGAKIARGQTNIHLMNFIEFQNTFFNEWREGVFLLLARVRDETLPIFRAQLGFSEYGTDIVAKQDVRDINLEKKY